MAPSKWRTECVGEEKENEPTSQESDNKKKLNKHYEDVTVEGKENQGNAETLVVFFFAKFWFGIVLFQTLSRLRLIEYPL